MSDSARTRTYSWGDPAETAAEAASMSGLEFLRSSSTRERRGVPFGSTLEMSIAEVEEGRVVFTVVPEEFHYNPIGVVHAGLALTLIDSAIGCAVHSMLPKGTGYTTLETKANFVRPIRKDVGRLLCEGKIVHFGRRSATGEARLTDEAGKLYAHGTSTCLILSP